MWERRLAWLHFWCQTYFYYMRSINIIKDMRAGEEKNLDFSHRTDIYIYSPCNVGTCFQGKVFNIFYRLLNIKMVYMKRINQFVLSHCNQNIILTWNSQDEKWINFSNCWKSDFFFNFYESRDFRRVADQ